MGRIGEIGTSQAQISTKLWPETTACIGPNFPIGDNPGSMRGFASNLEYPDT